VKNHQAQQGLGDYLYAHSTTVIVLAALGAFIIGLVHKYRENPDTFWVEIKEHFTLQNIWGHFRPVVLMFVGVVAIIATLLAFR
jgi:hypothetical protein